MTRFLVEIMIGGEFNCSHNCYICPLFNYLCERWLQYALLHPDMNWDGLGLIYSKKSCRGICHEFGDIDSTLNVSNQATGLPSSTLIGSLAMHVTHRCCGVLGDHLHIRWPPHKLSLELRWGGYTNFLYTLRGLSGFYVIKPRLCAFVH